MFNIGSDTARNIILHTSNNSNFSAYTSASSQPLVNSTNNITGIIIPNSLDGLQLQVRVVLIVLDQVVSNLSAPAILGKQFYIPIQLCMCTVHIMHLWLLDIIYWHIYVTE